MAYQLYIEMHLNRLIWEICSLSTKSLDNSGAEVGGVNLKADTFIFSQHRLISLMSIYLICIFTLEQGDLSSRNTDGSEFKMDSLFRLCSQYSNMTSPSFFFFFFPEELLGVLDKII